MPSSVDTKSPASTWNAFGVSARKSNSGRYRRPTSSAPLIVPTRSARGQLVGVRVEPRLGEDVALPVLLHHGVVDVGPDGDSQVRRQRPRRGRPREHAVATFELEPHGQRRILTVAVDVVHAGLGVAERRLAAPAVREHPEPLVDETLLPQGLERPHDALHVVEVEGLVVVVEVDPPGLTGDVALPVARVPQHARAAHVVELVDAEGGDRRVAGDAELALGFDLGGQAVAVPPEATLDASPTHRLVPRHGVLDEAGQQVPVVRQPVGERWPVVEHVLVAAVLAGGAQFDRRFERAIVGPPVEHGALDRRQDRVVVRRRDIAVVAIVGQQRYRRTRLLVAARFRPSPKRNCGSSSGSAAHGVVTTGSPPPRSPGPNSMRVVSSSFESLARSSSSERDDSGEGS